MQRADQPRMAPKRRRITPARAAYNARFPTFSGRVPRELYLRAVALRKSTGKTFATLLAEAVGAQEAYIGRAVDIARAEVMKKYVVAFACCECGEAMHLLHPDAKAMAGEFLTQSGWGHAECIARGNSPS